ncbi:MAG: ABC transporter substrate-binding protein [Alphaproteobacteria bacterium]|nr:ABC transporter substrate-binding protein [Alphaproteobacteria bacterium]
MSYRLLGLVAALSLAALAGSASASAAVFRWANDGDVSSMDPYTRNETVQLSFLANIYEPLIRRNKELGLEPSLAVKWEQTSPTVWRFHLREGVKFTDGTPLTADDVVFSLGRVKSPNSVLRATLGSVKEARKVDNLTVDFDTGKPDPILPQELTTFGIMSKAWAEKNNAVEPVNLSSGQENYAIRHAMGTGPYVLVSREPDRRTVIEANPNWWDKREGNVTRSEFNVISNASTRVAALLSGEIDMIYSVPPQDMDRIKHTEGLKLITGPELRTIFLGMDQWRDELLRSNIKGKNPLKDVRVREAFALAIDEAAIASRIMRGQAHPTWQMWGPGVNGFDKAQNERPKADPAKAKQLLAEAGYPNGFSMSMDCPNDRYVNDEAICTAVVAMLARIGVKVDLTAQTKIRFFSKIAAPAYDTDFYMLGWTPATYDAHNALYNLIATRKLPQGEVNYGGYSNPQMDDLIASIGVEADPAKRDAMIHQATAILQKDFGYIPLHQQMIAWAARKNIELVQMADNYFPLRFVKVK